MDPLSVTASIIAVIQATNAVISVCYDYSSAVNNSPWELSRIIEEIRSLRNVLETLERLAANAERADPAAETRLSTLKLLCEPEGGQNGPLTMCLAELDLLKKKLVPPRWVGGVEGSKRMALAQALSWPLKEKDTQKTLDRIRRFSDTLNLAITADQATLAMKIEDMAQVIQDMTLDIKEDLEKLNLTFTATRIDDHREKIYRWLSAPDPSSNYNKARKDRLATTGSWFTENKRFTDWKTKPKSFLWLHGIPGCGKTILSSKIVEEVLNHCRLDSTPAADPKPALAVVYFYFDFNEIEKQQHKKMICSLITQLSMQRESTPQALESLFSAHAKGCRQPEVDALLTTFRQLVKEFDEVFIILDALDECKDREELLEDIEQIVGWELEKVHILATSRREKDIEEGLDLNDQEKVCIQSALVNDDILSYVRERLRTDRKLKRWQKKPEAQQEIEETLMDKADGMFRWVVCQLDTLGKCLSLYELRKALRSLPTTLDETYARILCSIDENRSEDALKILQWLAYSARPLQIEEVAEVIAVDIKGNPRFDPEKRFQEPRDVLQICSSLVTTSVGATEGARGKTTGEQIRLAHFSVKEYLVSKRIQAGKATHYSIQEVRANGSMAEICLAYLLQFDKPNSLSSQTVEATKEFPLARYAARYWTQHTRKAMEDTGAANVLSIELLSHRNAFINWIRLFDLDKPWAEPDIARNLDSVPRPLYYASHAGLIEPARFLLEQGADVNAQGGICGNALQAVSAGGHSAMVEQLLCKGADINAQGGEYGTALLAASYRGHDAIVQRLVEEGAEVDLRDDSGRTPIYRASEAGHESIVRILIENKANVYATDSVGWTALNEAAPAGDAAIARVLLENGIDANSMDDEGHTVLHHTAAQGHDAMVRLLLEMGADVSIRNYSGVTALHQAALGGHESTVQVLLQAGAHIDAQDDRGSTALHGAVRKGDEVTVQVLLDNGVTITADEDGWTPLHLAVLKENEAIVQLLLNYGADAKAEDVNGMTALDWAAMDKHGTDVGKLEDMDSNKAKRGFVITGVAGAAYLGDGIRVRALLASGEDINEKGDGGFTSLLWAAWQGDKAMVELLVENGAAVNAKNDVGETAMDIAAYRGHDAIAELLQNDTCVNVDVDEHEHEILAALKRQKRILQLLEG